MRFTELKSLTGVRGIAALYVIIYHWYATFTNQRLTPSDVASIDNPLNSFLGHGYLSVDLFFILSGFVLSLSVYKSFENGVSLHGWKTFMSKRFLRIFPLYIIITILYFLLFERTDPLTFVVNLTLMQGVVPYANDSIIPPGWSLTNEWVMYLAFPLFFYLAYTFKDKNWILFLLAFSILVFLSEFRSLFFNWGNYLKMETIQGFHPTIDFTRGPASFLRTGAAYLLGVFAFVLYNQQKRFPVFKYLVVPLTVLFFYKQTDIIIILAIPFFILYIVEENWMSRFLASRPVHFLGLISYSLYVNHYLFLNSSSTMAKALGVNTASMSLWYTLFGTLILSCLTYYGIEKPGMAYFRKNKPMVYSPVKN